MPLIPCGECQHEMSSEAPTCPSCGKPNAQAVKKGMDSKQGLGCLLILLSIPAALLLGPVVSGVIFIVGLILLLLNTRLW